MNAVEKHPQRQEIINRLLAGETCRKIGATIAPPVHHSTIARFKVEIIGGAVRSMRGTSAKVRQLKEIASNSNAINDSGEVAAAESDKLRHAIQDKLEGGESDLRRWLQHAETGDIDHKALASHFRNSLSLYELQAKLGGLLQDGARSAQITNNIQLILPRPSDAPTGQVIDITPE